MSLSRIIAVGGGTGSGKSTIGKLGEEHGYKVFETSDLLRMDLEKLGIKNASKSQCIQRVEELVADFGSGFMGQLASEFAEKQEADKVMVCGIRHPEQLHTLKKIYGVKALSVFIDADWEIRLARAVLRAKVHEVPNICIGYELTTNLRNIILKELIRSDATDLEGTKQESDHIINNNPFFKERFIQVASNILRL